MREFRQIFRDSFSDLVKNKYSINMFPDQIQRTLELLGMTAFVYFETYLSNTQFEFANDIISYSYKLYAFLKYISTLKMRQEFTDS